MPFWFFNSHLNLKGTQLRHEWFCCVYFCLPNLINPMHIQQPREMIPPPRQNNVAVCNQITFLIIYYISFGFITLLKVIDAPIKTSDILNLSVSFKFLNFICSFFLFLKCLQVSSLTSIRLSTYIPIRLGRVI